MKKLKKYKFLLIPAIAIIAIGIIALIIFANKKANIKENIIETENYIMKYDETWEVQEKNDTSAILNHEDNAQIKLNISEIEEEYQYSEMEDIIDEIIYNINKSNSEYKLIKKEEKKLTKNEYDSYRLLYENDTNQILISTFKVGEKLITITYEAENEYFDILLDSANTIINSFEIKEKTLDLSNTLNIETKKIELGASSKLDTLISETKNVEIANNNYCVNYTIPACFKETSLNSQIGIYRLDKIEDGSIMITTNVYTRNIYEAISDGNSLSLLSEYNYYKDNDGFEESIDTIERNGFSGYIYKNSYYLDNVINTEEKTIAENVKIIYSLNANHVFVITIEGRKVELSDKLLEKIQINSSTNYSSYVTSQKQDGYIIGTLKRLLNSSENQTEEINIKLPEKYKEQDQKLNIFENKKYVFDYNDELEEYNYEIEYNLSTLNEESIKKLENDSLLTAYGEPTYMTELGIKNINGKEFKEFSCSEINLSGIMYTNINRKKYTASKIILLYQLESGAILKIKITGNNNEITDEILNEATNFDVQTN